MTSKSVSVLLTDLGVTRSHCRPKTSNGNPVSEAHFKTVKYSGDSRSRSPRSARPMPGARDSSGITTLSTAIPGSVGIPRPRSTSAPLNWCGTSAKPPWPRHTPGIPSASDTGRSHRSCQPRSGSTNPPTPEIPHPAAQGLELTFREWSLPRSSIRCCCADTSRGVAAQRLRRCRQPGGATPSRVQGTPQAASLPVRDHPHTRQTRPPSRRPRAEPWYCPRGTAVRPRRDEPPERPVQRGRSNTSRARCPPLREAAMTRCCHEERR